MPDRGHHLIVTKSDDWTEDEPDFDHDVVCLDPPSCGGWQECLDPHEVDGVSAAEGPYDSPEDAPWCDEEEFTFHGVLHEWRYGYGWTVPFPGCVVAANDHVCDSAYDIGRRHGEGTYVVDDEWDDTYCTLLYVGPAREDQHA